MERNSISLIAKLIVYDTETFNFKIYFFFLICIINAKLKGKRIERIYLLIRVVMSYSLLGM